MEYMNYGPSLVVVDFGCGYARLARSVKNKVFSFDYISSDPSVIACDYSLPSTLLLHVDVAVFCLSLMGTNFPKRIRKIYIISYSLLKCLCSFSNKMFLLFYFQKKKQRPNEQRIKWPKLKPCLCKRR
ncbi:ribosomal RNA-processing protein 8-like [Primulina huaijiensis]|uniref:ribosomal RNA-processing protein 8-like n=1 Tax=Primulina huaijiensis TaxID=1492673 RepID=UPI003CC740C5